MAAEEDVTPSWKRIAIEWMNARGVNRAELARRLGVTRGAITQLFSTAKKSSLVAPINQMMLEDPQLRDAEPSEEALLVEHLAREILDARTQDGALEPDAMRSEIRRLSSSGRSRLFEDVLDVLRAASAQEAVAAQREHEAEMELEAARQQAEEARKKLDEARDALDRLKELLYYHDL